MLHKWTESTLHQDRGETVMTDTPDELSWLLECVLCAHGDVLVTGLGLGCVVRGLLARPTVRSITVIEREAAVLALVAPTLPASVRVIHADALQWAQQTTERFDMAWHDLWSDPDRHEPHLSVLHAELMAHLARRCPRQGAWKFPRPFRQAMRRTGQYIGTTKTQQHTRRLSTKGRL